MKTITPKSHVIYMYIKIRDQLEYQMAQTDHKHRKTNRRTDETSSPEQQIVVMTILPHMPQDDVTIYSHFSNILFANKVIENPLPSNHLHNMYTHVKRVHNQMCENSIFWSRLKTSNKPKSPRNDDILVKISDKSDEIPRVTRYHQNFDCNSHDSDQCPLWSSCQIRKIAGCACAGNTGNIFPTSPS